MVADPISESEAGGGRPANGTAEFVSKWVYGSVNRPLRRTVFGAQGGGGSIGAGMDDDFLAGLEEAKEEVCGSGNRHMEL